MRAIPILILTLFGLLAVAPSADARAPRLAAKKAIAHAELRAARLNLAAAKLNAREARVFAADLRRLSFHDAAHFAAHRFGLSFYDGRALLLSGAYGYIAPPAALLQSDPLPVDPAPVDPAPLPACTATYAPPATAFRLRLASPYYGLGYYRTGFRLRLGY